MTAKDYLRVSRVPWGLFGPEKDFAGQGSRIWTIRQLKLTSTLDWQIVGASIHTCLLCYNTKDWRTFSDPDVVMEDSDGELSKHLPIMMAARGRVLVTGLGLGCVVRGLLHNPGVTHIDVVEKDGGILKVVGPEFEGNPRVKLHHDDAFEFHVRGKWWDFAWHDIHIFGDGLQLLHVKLLKKYQLHVGRQGAWAYPRIFAKVTASKFGNLLGSPKIGVS